MPGRQSGRAPTLTAKSPAKKTTLGKRKTSNKRALDALALAEEQTPAKKGPFRSTRLGESEPARKKLRSGNDESGAESEDSEKSWAMADEDDESSELDSDDALCESDEERFEGFRFGEDADPAPAEMDEGVDLAAALDDSLAEDEPADEADKLASLQGALQQIARPKETPQADNHESKLPSDFGITSRQKLTVDDLAASIGNSDMKKSLKLLGSAGKRLDAPLPQRQQDRIDRGAAYDKAKDTLARWIETVKQNRRAEHLSFPLQDPHASLPQGERRMVPIAKPMNELEVAVQDVLQQSGMLDTDGKTAEDRVREFEELKSNKMPLEEVMMRQAELRRQRELLFREEMRSRRIKKIKSKTYRKIHRRERKLMQQQLDDDENSDSAKERNDRRRAEERMGARHRDSRWAKSVKDSGRQQWDEEARDGMMEMARRNEELRRRMEGKMEENDPDDDRSEEEYSVPDAEPNESRLANLGFMKKAEASRRAQNDAELRDIEGVASDSGSETGRRTYGPKPGAALIEESDGSEREPIIDAEKIDAPLAKVPKSFTDVANPALNAEKKGRRQEHNSISAIATKQAASKQERGLIKATSDKQIASPQEDDSTPAPLKRKTTSTQEPNLISAPFKEQTRQDDVDSQSESEPIVFRNAELARRAFAGDDVVANFEQEKAALVQEQQPQEIDTTLPGWGAWIGQGVSKRAAKIPRWLQTKEQRAGVDAEKRKDVKLKDVIISERRVKKNAKYLANQLPHPFESRTQYERSLRLPVGPEWSTKETVQTMTTPRLLMKPGVIRPMIRPTA